MKLTQFLFSPTGGTERALDALCAGLPGDAERIDLSDADKDFSAIEMNPADYAVIAVPSFGGRVPGIAAERIGLISGNGCKCIIMAVYGNRAYEDTLVELQDVATEAGFSVIAAVAAIAEHSIMHQFATGRPDDDDKAALDSFASVIVEKLDAETFVQLALPGDRPYRDTGAVPLIPKANKECTSCGLCAEKCPVKAIDPNSLRVADKNACISCMRCVVRCPTSTRHISKLMVSAASRAMEKACSVRKECEIYI